MKITNNRPHGKIVGEAVGGVILIRVIGRVGQYAVKQVIRLLQIKLGDSAKVIIDRQANERTN